MDIRRIKLTIAYDGTAYHGWQYQSDVPTIEGELRRALVELLGVETTVIGASRTDAGVHALGNVAVFDMTGPIPAEKMAPAINRHLPPDIRIMESAKVAPDFHPRKVSCQKTYEYRIWHTPMAWPTQRLYHYFIHYPLDVEQMQVAATYVIGEHDFKSFCNADAVVDSTVRTIFTATVHAENNGREIVIRITGNGFLYNMVRIIVGTLINVGAGRYPPQQIKDIMDARDRKVAGPTVAAHGLTLMGYEF